MLSVNVRGLLRNKGIKHPVAWLRKHGFGHTRAVQLANNQVRELKLDQLETLCFFLQCTPNDVFSYTPTKITSKLSNEVPPPGHPLYALHHAEGQLSLAERLVNMSQPQVQELARLMDEGEGR